jgi:hypothetical protein
MVSSRPSWSSNHWVCVACVDLNLKHLCRFYCRSYTSPFPLSILYVFFRYCYEVTRIMIHGISEQAHFKIIGRNVTYTLWSQWAWFRRLTLLGKSLHWKARYRPKCTLFFLWSAVNYWLIVSKVTVFAANVRSDADMNVQENHSIVSRDTAEKLLCSSSESS